ncbi:hypothetical protein GCM10011359_31460 [Nesterenkonia alkaliphila]|uniref:transposase n=1 Tax=Nesterenkonia alkaliphila TaxID=1463631 RepID=UPI0019C88B20|nr:hypothetical protein GCM10011359_31460 [Nesterenkonia alkaliphila]
MSILKITQLLLGSNNQGLYQTRGASLGGIAPLPASSGNTTRHRLSRSGDRQLNRAIDVITRTRMSCDPTTRDYGLFTIDGVDRLV